MKKLFSVALLSLCFVGCGTTSSIYKGEGVVITTVDTGMKAWKDYVVAGKATQAQVDTVKDAYNKYYDAQMLAKAALEKYIASKTPNDSLGAKTANDAVIAAESSLLNLFTQFIK